MSVTEHKDEPQVKATKPRAVLLRSLGTGFIGGILASILGVFMYYFNFSEVAARSFLLRPWLKVNWTDAWQGDIVSIVIIGLISILAAIIYYGLFRKINSMWMGVVFGFVLWWLVFYVCHPIFPNIPAITEMHKSTIISTICLYVFYGLFIGYSIAYDHYDSSKIKEIIQENN